MEEIILRKIKTPFFMVNPKSYLYGKKLLKLALAADAIAKEKILMYFYSTFCRFENDC